MNKLIFSIGFGIGFLLAILILTRKTIGREIDQNMNLENEKQTFLTYKNWLDIENIKITEIDIDYLIYGSNSKTIPLESDFLRSKVHVTCVVYMQDKMDKIETIKSTWAQYCNSFHYFSKSPSNIIRDIKLASSWQLLCEAMRYIWLTGLNDNRTLEWVIFVKDDTIVIPENLRHLVAPLNHNEDYYLGHSIKFLGQIYNVAQAGYVLSRGAFSKLINVFNTSEKCQSGGKYWKKEDYYLGKHLNSMGINVSDTRDKQLLNIFNGYTLQQLQWGITKGDSYWTRALFPPKMRSCSPMSVTFSSGGFDRMFTLNYLLYRLRVFRGEAVHGKKCPTKPFSEEQVWKMALKEEFNISDFSNISNEAYYQIWRSKYSAPREIFSRSNSL